MKIAVLGAGISGLTAAYWLGKRQREAEITVFEKEERVGGVMESAEVGGFFFERGPRTFRAEGNGALISLIRELGLEQEMIFSNPKSRGKYLWIGGKMRKLPLWNWGLVRALLSEWSVRRQEGDETVWDFAVRRFNPTVARELFEPLVTGIYAADPRELSVEACFPSFKRLEQEYGSLTRGWMQRHKGSPGLFSLRKGMGQLVEALVERGRFEVRCGQPVEAHLAEILAADQIVSALPLHEMCRFFLPEEPAWLATSLTVVNCGFHAQVLQKKGFGYLVAREEGEEVLGVVFDSNCFTEHNRSREETRLTVMLRGLPENAQAQAKDALRRHLGIEGQPDACRVVQFEGAFPQMGLGYRQRVRELEARVREREPRVRLVGNYLGGLSVSECVGVSSQLQEIECLA